MKEPHINLFVTILLCLVALTATAQETTVDASRQDTTSVALATAMTDTTEMAFHRMDEDMPLRVDTVLLDKELNKLAKKQKRDWTTWKPDPKRAMWLALVIPGAGQIYNRKYWKLPIIYGGFLGCAYAMRWNNQMYLDYSQAYLDIMDNDPTTESYNQFLHLGAQITSANIERYKQIFKSRKDKYRRWRDLSFFCMLGVYALSVIDAYVDASLSSFDISDDLSLHVAPAVINSKTSTNSTNAIGVAGALRF